jgi:hypothetical protein
MVGAGGTVGEAAPAQAPMRILVTITNMNVWNFVFNFSPFAIFQQDTIPALKKADIS